jgi:hypothetical protein
LRIKTELFVKRVEISRTPAIGAIVAGYRRARSLPSAKSEWIVQSFK